MIGNSKEVASNQNGNHPRLAEVVRRHLTTENLEPLRESTVRTFAEIAPTLKRSRLLIDSGCGVGLSSILLAQKHPNHIVLGIDKSLKRLGTGRTFKNDVILNNNLVLLRADCTHIWKLLLLNQILPEKHYVLYPNPWPKSCHLKRRWHGHPSFSNLLKLGGELELRSNWKTYVDEFAKALKTAGMDSHISLIRTEQTISTAFERKYLLSGHTLYRLESSLFPA